MVTKFLGMTHERFAWKSKLASAMQNTLLTP